MRQLLFLAFYKNRLAYLSGALLVALRVFQLFAINAGAPVNLDSMNVYGFCNGAHSAAFILIPLFTLTLIQPATIIASPHFAVGSNNRKRAATRCSVLTFLIGAVCSIATNASSVFVIVGLAPDRIVWAPLMISTVLQTIVFTTNALLYMVLFLMFERGAVSFLGCFLYGLWDFMAQNVVGGGVPSVGWGLTLSLSAFQPLELFYRTAILLFELIILLFVLLFVFEEKDYTAIETVEGRM